jgi:nucleoside-diphosphate-sugar epimerase
MSNAGMTVTVFGSSGFLGRYVVNALGMQCVCAVLGCFADVVLTVRVARLQHVALYTQRIKDTMHA